MPSSNHHRQVVRKNSPPTPSPRTITSSSSSTDYLPFAGEFLPGVAPNCFLHQHYPIATGFSSDSKGNCRNATEMFFKVSHTLRSVLRIVNDPFLPLCLLFTLQPPHCSDIYGTEKNGVCRSIELTTNETRIQHQFFLILFVIVIPLPLNLTLKLCLFTRIYIGCEL